MRKRGSIPRGSGYQYLGHRAPVPRNWGTRHLDEGHVRPTEQGYTSLGNRPPLPRKEQPQSAVTGYTSLGKGEALHRTWGSRPQLRGTRPRENGGPVLGTAIPAPREWGTRHSGKGYICPWENR